MLTRNSLAWWLVTAVVGCSSSTSVDTPQSGGGSGSGGATSGGGSGGASGSGGTAGTGGAAPDPGSCEHYCQTIAVNCEAFPQYPSDVTCIATCELWELGMEMDRSGNSRACRLYLADAPRCRSARRCCSGRCHQESVAIRAFSRSDST